MISNVLAVQYQQSTKQEEQNIMGMSVKKSPTAATIKQRADDKAQRISDRQAQNYAANLASNQAKKDSIWDIISGSDRRNGTGRFAGSKGKTA